MENCNFNLYDYEGWDVTIFNTYDVVKSTFIIFYERVTLYHPHPAPPPPSTPSPFLCLCMCMCMFMLLHYSL